MPSSHSASHPPLETRRRVTIGALAWLVALCPEPATGASGATNESKSARDASGATNESTSARDASGATNESGTTGASGATNESTSATGGSILLLRSAGDVFVMRRVRAELRAAGWRVSEVDGQGGCVGSELGDLATQLAAVAALCVDVRDGRIELHLRRSWGNVDEVLRSDVEVVEDAILAIRVTEALRAHGLDLGPLSTGAGIPVGSTRASSEVIQRRATGNTSRAPVAAVTAPAPTKKEAGASRAIWLQAAPALLEGSGGMPMFAAGWIGVRAELSDFWSLSGTGLLALSALRVNEEPNAARVTIHVMELGVEQSWLRSLRGSFGTSFGIGRTIVNTEGRQSGPGYIATTDTTGTSVVYVGVRGALALAPRWNAFAALQGGMSYPEVSIAFGERVVRAWGQPFAVLALGLEMQGVRW